MRRRTLIAITLLCGACSSRAAAPARPLPEPAPAPARPSVPVPPPYDPATVCVIENGALRDVPISYNSTTGDTTVDGRLFKEVYPTALPYAAAESWYVSNQPIYFKGHRYTMYGLPRVLGIHEVERVGEYLGVPVFASAGMERPDVFYLMVRPGCEFQPYMDTANVSGVRGR